MSKTVHTPIMCIIAIILATLLPGPFANAQSAFATSKCDLEHQQSVYWVGLEQMVQIEARLIDNVSGAFGPTGHIVIELNDGTKINLPSGQKYYDDYAENNPPSCQDYLGKMLNQTIYSLSGKNSDLITQSPNASADFAYRYQVRPNSPYELRADLLFAALDGQKELCLPPLPDGYHKNDCQKLSNIRGELSDNPLPDEIKTKLINHKAPIIAVTMSTYYGVYLAYDPVTDQLYELYSSGC